ncbi:MAG: site-specific integrase [Actinomycetota bacterium]|nr:site-specific integrase [Actinomycetota bacterium]
MTANRRTPVESRGRRIPGLYARMTADGREVFEYRARLNGRVITRKLAAHSRTEAVAEVEALRSEARSRDVVTADRRLTIARLAELFQQALEVDQTLSPRTREDLRLRLHRHIIPQLGRLRVCDLDSYAVRRFARRLPPMRAKTHRNVLSVLSSMLTWAVAEGLAPENAVARARERFPRDLRRIDAERFEPRALAADELERALAKVGQTYRPLVAFIAETGARVSEALGVRFADVDLTAGTWSVSGQLGDKGTVRPAKTPGSMATVPLSDAALAIVRGQRRKLMRRGFGSVAAEAFVFTGRNGQPLSRRNALRAWQQATKAALGRPLRLHDLRTTFASRLAANNVDIATAQALLRHSRPSTTLDVYTRVRGDAATRLERMRHALDA